MKIARITPLNLMIVASEPTGAAPTEEPEELGVGEVRIVVLEEVLLSRVMFEHAILVLSLAHSCKYYLLNR